MSDENGEKPIVIRVHPLLLEEFKFLKDSIEQKVGYKIYGGMPIVSKLIAMQLKEKRQNNKNVIEVHSNKVRGEKKIRLYI
jgi:hypothetical protein